MHIVRTGRLSQVRLPKTFSVDLGPAETGRRGREGGGERRREGVDKGGDQERVEEGGWDVVPIKKMAREACLYSLFFSGRVPYPSSFTLHPGAAMESRQVSVLSL